MTQVVSDTGPLNYLVLIGASEILPKLFSQVFIPARVLKELSHEKTPETVRLWAGNLPNWIAVKNAVVENKFPNLDAGEVEALALALNLSTKIVLLDDFAARLTAEDLGLTPVGTLGVLLLAADAGLLNFDVAFEKLRRTTFRMSAELVEAIERKHRFKAD